MRNVVCRDIGSSKETMPENATRAPPCPTLRSKRALIVMANSVGEHFASARLLEKHEFIWLGHFG
jgi:hypothetical protein